MKSNVVSEGEHPASGAERRQLTLLFCDLVDSTALAERLDPEDYGHVVDLYHRTCEAVIERFEGRVAQYLGDGVLAYFGYPIAHEDDARRGVLAALGIVEALEQLNRRLEREQGLTLGVRQGVHTGLVVVGETGRRARPHPLAVGEAPNVAARLQSLAAPHTVLISGATYRLVQGFFTFEDLGRRAIKGLSALLHVYRVIGESGAQSRLEVTGPQGLTALVGRDHELEILLERWVRVKAGEGRVVLLSGEPGVGKSRLVAALKEQVANEGGIRLECRCSPYHQQTTLYPVIELLQRMLKWRRSESSIERLDKLEGLLAPFDVRLAETVPLLAALLALPVPEYRYPPLMLTPPRQRARTLETLLAVLRCIATRRPLLVIAEDFHWADPTTLELFTLLLTQPAPSRLLTLLTFRPEFRPPWDARDDHTALVVAPLTREETITMITRVANDKRLPAPVVEQLVANTDGNPLFIEELTKTVLESGLLRETEDGYVLADTPLTLAIPATLHDSLIARLDHLGPAKPVAQVAAILGRTFSHDLLQAVCAADTPTETALGRLVEAGLLYQQGPSPIARYQFKHALVQEAAYQSLLRSTRQQAHLRVAQTLAEKFPEIAETQPELVAHHYTEAGRGAEALPYWQRAGERAVERSAYREAISHLTKGLALLTHVPEGPLRIQHEIRLQITLGAPLMATRGYTAQDVEKVFGRARELCRQIGETPQLFTALRGLRQFYQIRGDSPAAYELGEQLLRLAERAQDSSFLMEAHNALGGALYWMGEFGSAHEHFETVIRLYDRRQHRFDASLYANEPGVVAYSYTMWTLWFLGFADQSLQRIDKALALARELAHPFSVAQALAYAAAVYYFRRESQATREWAEQVIAISNEHGFPFWLAMGATLRGWALAEQGETAEGIAQLRHGLAARRAGGTELARPAYMAMLAQALIRAGQVDDASAALDEALATVSDRADRTYEAVEVHHTKGELLLAQRGPRDAEAEACFRHALLVARRQGTKSWELRAALSLSRLLERRGNLVDARRELAAVYGWFTEGLDAPDARAAEGLLAQLA